MAFRLSAKPLEVMWPVVVNIPANGGKTMTQKFSLKWIVLDTAEFDKRLPGITDFNIEEDSPTGSDPWGDFWAGIITGWKDIKGEKGDKPLGFNEQNLRTLIHVPYIQSVLLETYRDCIMGRQAKN